MLDLHESTPIHIQGESLDDASAAMIMIHGRGGGPQSILSLINHVGQDSLAYLAPEAANWTWYPQRFIAPRQQNEPYLTSALGKVGSVVQQLEDARIPPEKIMLLGFSQGACLALEYAARNPRRYGAVVALSGGLIGAADELEGYNGTLENTPVFLGCSDVDFHIPLERVHESTDIIARLGASVEERIYSGMGHTINQDEVDYVRGMIKTVIHS